MHQQLILFLAASPDGTSPLELASEHRDIMDELRKSRYRDDFRVESRWAITVDDLMRCISELSPSILHFSGHGERGVGVVLQDQRGDAHVVSHAALARMIESTAQGLRVIVLNACHTEEQAESLCQHVDCVVSMSGAVCDADARAYSAGFYRALGYRNPIRRAHEQGVASVHARRSKPAPATAPGLRDIEAAPDELAKEPRLLVRNGVDPGRLVLVPASPRRRSYRFAAVLAAAIAGGATALLLWLGWPSRLSHEAAAEITPVLSPQRMRSAPEDPPKDAPADAATAATAATPRDATPDAAPPPQIEIVRPADGSPGARGFGVTARVPGDDISVDLFIDGHRVPSTAMRDSRHEFVAPEARRDGRSVQLQPHASAPQRPTAAKRGSGRLRPRDCWVLPNARHEALFAKPPCRSTWVKLDANGQAPGRKDVPAVDAQEMNQKYGCDVVFECPEGS